MTRPTHTERYAPLFAKLTEPGQSTALPLSVKSALMAAVAKHNKLKQGAYRVAKFSATECRIWRIA